MRLIAACGLNRILQLNIRRVRRSAPKRKKIPTSFGNGLIIPNRLMRMTRHLIDCQRDICLATCCACRVCSSCAQKKPVLNACPASAHERSGRHIHGGKIGVSNIYGNIRTSGVLYHSGILFKSFYRYSNSDDACDKRSYNADYFNNIRYSQRTLHNNHSFHHLLGRLYQIPETRTIRGAYILERWCM